MTRIVAKIVTLEEDSKGAAVAKDLAMCCTSPGEEEDVGGWIDRRSMPD